MSIRHITLCFILTLFLAACSTTQQPGAIDIERSNVKTSYATVEQIDHKNRKAVLRNPEKKAFTIDVSEEIDLSQVKVGDIVNVTYSETVNVRKAEPGEVVNSADTFIDNQAKGGKPATTRVAERQTTAQVADINLTNETATLLMTDGSYRVIKVADPSILTEVEVGEVIVITAQKAVAITVQGK